MSRASVSPSSFVTLLGGQFYAEDDGSVMANLVIDSRHEGPPGFAHGGTLASLLDEAMGAAVWYSGVRVAAVHLSIDYKRAVPLGVQARVVGQVEQREGRKVFTTGAILLPDGAVAVSARGIFVEAPQIFPEGGLGFIFSPVRDE
ncbi:MAG: PaaI family thioesterase [Anaerolineae bacterium]|nr:PaaI family thioesterase [Anaerolineae bacterium]